MALLAYDPQRVGRLRQALVDASEDLRRVTCADPAAADAMRVVRATVAQLDATWLPFVTHLLDSDPLSGRTRKLLRINSLDQSLIRVMTEGYGWLAQADPLSDDTAIVTTEEARALGAMLNKSDPMVLANQPDQLAWLAQQLAVIGRNPALSAEFLTNFHHWEVLSYALAEQRAFSYGPDYTGATSADDLDPVFDGLMAVWTTTLPVAILRAGATASIRDMLPPMHEPDPYVQALMLRALHLDPTMLATVANDLLRTWLDNKEQFNSGSLDLAVNDGPNIADLLLPRIADNATASTHFLSLIGDRPALLFQTLDDPEIGYRIALAGTDPAHAKPAEAGVAVLSILDYFRTDPYATAPNTDGDPGDYGPFLGQLVAPWLLQFTGSNREWVASSATRTRLLAVALNDEEALQALVAASQRMTDGLARSLTVVANDSDTIERSKQIGELLSLLGQLVVNEHVDDANERSTFLWDLTWTVLAAATNFVPGGAVANVAAGTGVTALESVLAPYLLGPTGDEVRHDGELAMDVALTITASVMMTALFQSWQKDGRVGADATPPPLPQPPESDSQSEEEDTVGCPSSDYLEHFDQWARELPGGAHGELRRSAVDLVEKFIGGSQASEHCAELMA